ncbi:MAG: bifunctional ornithine acetyltransferase/N-acetylglutamate synthase [Candidatus Gastranaerophilales bacterium]|nr:bifunctional ornithine acetyltransferase/N-acetylglutamate synthase [Candidatus Gastranaerophilales bacterium]
MKITNNGITSPKGFKAAGEHAGIKKAKKDLGIIYSEKPALCSAVFTKNVVKAAPLQLALKVLSENSYISAIAINSGNANACTGEQGYKDAVDTSKTLADCLGLKENEVLVSSTGVIGQLLDRDKIINGVKNTCKKLSSSQEAANDCANAIMTTDTIPKQITVETEIGGKTVIVSGIAKGSGMIHPNMATMLGFLTTDAAITKDMLDKAFKSRIDDSFNMITVDGETSTNDTCLILANGMAENPLIDKENDDFKLFEQAVDTVVKYLAKQIVMDGEGATKFLEVNIKGTATTDDARVLCKSILNSQLVKTAFFGKDANWGRILSAMGASGVNFNPEKVKITFKNKIGSIDLFENGTPYNFDEDFALKILDEREIQIDVKLNEGGKEITGWGCDLSYDYVKINAEYRT